MQVPRFQKHDSLAGKSIWRKGIEYAVIDETEGMSDHICGRPLFIIYELDDGRSKLGFLKFDLNTGLIYVDGVVCFEDDCGG